MKLDMGKKGFVMCLVIVCNKICMIGWGIYNFVFFCIWFQFFCYGLYFVKVISNFSKECGYMFIYERFFFFNELLIFVCKF